MAFVSLLPSSARNFVKMSQDLPMLLSKFQGCLVSAVAGDCLGAYYEGRTNVSSDKVKEFLETKAKDESRNHAFTDDTAMARSVAQSLIEQKGLDVQDMARRFTEEYFCEPHRGYGASVGVVFDQLKEEKFACPHGPASNQFEGQGSYGNGGAMRIAPAALFGCKYDQDKLNALVNGVTRITHTHPDAINGAILESTAIVQALNTPTNTTLIPSDVIDSLLSCMNLLEPLSESDQMSDKQTLEESDPPRAEELPSETARAEERASNAARAHEQASDTSRTVNEAPCSTADEVDSEILADEEEYFESLRAEEESGEPPNKRCRRRHRSQENVSQPYCQKLRKMKEFLAENAPLCDVVYELGNNVSALGSVPAAVYCFLKCLDPASESELQISNPIERTIYLAICLGGDTDTIATMAAAIAGAYYGLDTVPSSWLNSCEGAKHALYQAEALYKLTENQH